ncbi:hypothetical protein HDEF_0098 [Candidatus Hamiltonella defensa 5AT (Acyrthosiphon pisum)]|uniref:Uncharacterized protein n=1 Tax=Hamiltonella defensa subsp. Acyrthosiphon pisum (strain 5AT) TaxID=572265 RepID=C4K8N7_HAMD5|nr:hypothetical protein HDEF_0098 [Candidatus Hamiltonella defensa 5AT (Acyrthosiphon pisum)]
MNKGKHKKDERRKKWINKDMVKMHGMLYQKE